MTCFHPIPAYQAESGEVVFHALQRHGKLRDLQLACGQCRGCRLERSRQWAVRCMHEAMLHDENSFVTLTYSDEHLPSDRSLVYRPFQLFMKRLRRARSAPILFYMCGEYGDLYGRPHFHACLFNCGFPDRYYWKSGGEFKLYRSAELERLWPFGDSTIGDVTFESAAYVARYCMKKKTGDGEKDYYNLFDVETGEIVPRLKEFAHMSLNPAIGKNWLERYRGDVKRGKIVVRSKLAPLPRYYKKKLSDSERMDIDEDNSVLHNERAADNTADRLLVREVVTEARLALFKRSLGD